MSKGMRMLAIDRTMRNNRNGMRNENDMIGMGYGGMELRDNPNMRGYDRDRRGRFTGEMEMNRTYEYGPRSEHEMRNGYDMEGRFRDNRRSEHGGSMNYSGEAENHWMPPYYGEEPDMGMNRYGRNEMEETGGRMGEEMEQRNPVGFAAHFDSPGKSDASYQGIKEGNQMKGPSMQAKGGAMSQAIPKFNKRMAEEWTGKMQNEDGSKGPHWSMDQVEQIMQQKKVKCDPAEFYAVLNAMYSDYSEVAQKHGVHKQDFYLDMAKAFLMDKDSVKDKAAAYYMYIVKH